MNPTRPPDTSWIASAADRADAALRWTEEMKSLPGITDITGTVPDVTEIVGSVPSVMDMMGPIPSAADTIGALPSTTDLISASIPPVTGTIPGAVADVTYLTGGLVGDFSRGLSLSDYQQSIETASAAAKSPVLGGTFQPPTGIGQYLDVVATAAAVTTTTPSPAVPWKGERPLLRPDRQSPIHEPLRDPFLPSRPRRRESVQPHPTPAPAPEVRPEEIAEGLAQTMTRRHRQEAKGLLVGLGLDLELEHLEAIESRMSTDGRPDRLHAALSAGLLLEGLANRLFPAREEPWISRFEKEHDVGAENVRNRLTAFAEPLLRQWSTIEHKLFIAEFDLVGRWTGEGHHVVFSAEENSEAFRAFLKILATVARAHRIS